MRLNDITVGPSSSVLAQAATELKLPDALLQALGFSQFSGDSFAVSSSSVPSDYQSNGSIYIYQFKSSSSAQAAARAAITRSTADRSGTVGGFPHSQLFTDVETSDCQGAQCEVAGFVLPEGPFLFLAEFNLGFEKGTTGLVEAVARSIGTAVREIPADRASHN